MGGGGDRRGRRGRDPDHAARRLLPARRRRPARPTGVQQRFSDGDAERWAERVEALARARRRAWSAPRSTACARSIPRRCAAVAEWARRARAAPARPRLRAAGRERGLPRAPTASRRSSCSPRRARSASVHRRPRDAPHRRRRRAARRRRARAAASARRPSATSPTASGPPPRCAPPARRSPSGSDSHAVIDLLEEARAVELDERLASGGRGSHDAPSLLGPPPRAGTRHRLARGRADRAGRPRRPRHDRRSTAVRTAGADRRSALDAAVFAASAADVDARGRRWRDDRQRRPPPDARRRRRAGRIRSGRFSDERDRRSTTSACW